MSQVYLAFLWHLHQPSYYDRAARTSLMPWVRLHGVKDYTGLGLLLEEFPKVRCTVNFSPVLLDQIVNYVDGIDDTLLIACKRRPAELSEDDRRFLRRNLFFAHPDQQIRPYPRYVELQGLVHADRALGDQDWIDLQTLANLTWFHPLILESDADLLRLRAQGRCFSIADRDLVLARQRDVVRGVLPRWRALSDRGQVEISLSPYYHPIVPLLCDAASLREAMPHAPVPANGTELAPDAREHVHRARRRGEEMFGRPIEGMWPSEGSVSQAACQLMAAEGISWVASDEQILARSLHVAFERNGHAQVTRPDLLYRPHRLRHGPLLVFRDQVLSNLVSFSYKTWDPRHAAEDFVNRVAGAPDGALVTVALDGENPWEHYAGNGTPFLRALFGRLSDHPRIRTVSIGEGVKRADAHALDRVFAGSWINHNFWVWSGHEEDRRGWELVTRVRRLLVECGAPPEAWECLYAAEGSDWFWWFGEDYSSAQDAEFDALFRRHLSNACSLAKVRPPEELGRPVKQRRRDDLFRIPRATLHVSVDGQRTDYFEWISAGHYDLAREFGAMAGEAAFLSDIFFGFGEKELFLRLDFRSDVDPQESMKNAAVRLVTVAPAHRMVSLLPALAPARSALGRVFEAAVPLEALDGQPDGELEFFLEVERPGGVPARLPSLSPIRLRVPSADFHNLNWQV